MGKVTAFLSKIVTWTGTDGLLHIVCSALACFAFGWISPLWIAPLAALAIGMAKEMYDMLSGKGTAEWHDIVCDIAGIVLGMGITLLYLMMI